MNHVLSKVSLSIGGLPIEDDIEICKLAESLGFKGYWLHEVTGRDAFTHIAVLSQQTVRIRLGTSIVGIFGRSPLVTAIDSFSLNEISKGRFVLGLGTQAENYVVGWHGAKFRRPTISMIEYVTLVKSILSGERVSYDGKIFRMQNFKFQAKPSYDTKILVAAIGPRMIEVAGRVADGVIGNFWSEDYVRKTVIPNLKIGAQASGRKLEDLQIISGHACFPTDGSSAQVGTTKPVVVTFALVPYYRKIFSDSNFDDEYSKINKAMAKGDVKGALDAVTDEMTKALTIVGDRSEFNRRIQGLLAAGVNEVKLHPVTQL